MAKIIQLETMMPDWKCLNNEELLLAIGETASEINLKNVREARRKMTSSTFLLVGDVN